MQKSMTIQLTATNQKERLLLREIANQVSGVTPNTKELDIFRLSGGKYLAIAWPMLCKAEVELTEDRT